MSHTVDSASSRKSGFSRGAAASAEEEEELAAGDCGSVEVDVEYDLRAVR
jgi:hypothetical protein